MQNRITRLVVVLSIITVAMVLGMSTAIGQAAEPRIVMVTGEAEVYGDPVSASMTINIVETATNAVTATNEVNRRLAAVKQALVEQGIDIDTVRTSNLSLTANINYQTDYVKNYTVQHSLSVIILDWEGLGRVFDAVIAAGASNIKEIKYNVGDLQALQEKAMQAAVQEARRKAAVLVGLSVDQLSIHRIEDQSPSMQRPTFSGFGWFALDEPEGTDVLVRQIPIKAEVVVEFTF